jgi:cobyrinic acid a,c-diamide synthase
MRVRGLIVAAPRSGAGKTVATLALLAALRRRGLAVQAAKAGPDYIDPAFHYAATGRPSFNLDSWAMPPAMLDALVSEGGEHADGLVIEGVMGLFDGIEGATGRSGATSELAAQFRLPVLLVVDVSGQSQSAAALVRGFASHDPEVQIGGVVLNRVGSERHLSFVAGAIAALGVPVLGALPRDDALALPERHLGLVQAAEHADIAARLDRLAALAERHLDLDAILKLAACPHLAAGPGAAAIKPPGSRIALAQDEAFSFDYAHMLDGWRRAGAEIVPSPSDEPPPMIAIAAGFRAAIPSFMPDGSPLPRNSARDSRASPRRVPCTGSAAATWCSDRASKMRMAFGTRWRDCSATPRALRNGSSISAIARHACFPKARSAMRVASCAATNSIMRR